MKNKLSQTTLQSIDEDLPSTVKTDASDFAAATLNQNSKPVAFYARTFLYLFCASNEKYAVI